MTESGQALVVTRRVGQYCGRWCADMLRFASFCVCFESRSDTMLSNAGSNCAITLQKQLAQSAGTVECTNCFSAES